MSGQQKSKIILDAKGLILSPGELSRASGSLIRADNVNVEAPGIIRSRFGMARSANFFGGIVWKMISTKELGSNILHNIGSLTAAGDLRYGDGSAAASTPTGQGANISNVPATRMQCAVARRNHYLTSDNGVCRLESDMGAWMAGMPKGLQLDQTGTLAAPVTVLASGTGTGPVLADGSSCAYRVVWCRADQQSVEMKGSPLGRTVIYNNTRSTGYAGGVSKDINCRIILPKRTLDTSTALDVSHYFKLYRSRSETVGITPSDEMNLVATKYLTSANITAGYVDVLDSTPEAFRAIGEPLYTNEGIGGDVGVNGITGLQMANDPPPAAHDVVLFADCLFYSDLRYPYSVDFSLVSTVSGTGVTPTDTLTIGGVVYTAIGAVPPANNEFSVITVAGSPSNSESLERTAINLCEAINRSTTNTTVWAYYIANPEKPFGTIRIESRAFGSFTMLASAHTSAFSPAMDGSATATADVFPNGYAFSKPSEGDAVPPINVGQIGRNDTGLLRMVVLRDSIFMFTDGGIYRLTGRSADDFAVHEFDLSFRLIGREMVAVDGDFIYAWGYEGIAKISTAGIEYISNSIEPLLWKAVTDLATVSRSSGLSWLSTYGWATAYRSSHKVLFSIPGLATGNNAGNCTSTLVYDTRMNAWTKWTYTAATDIAGGTQGYSCGVVRVSDDLLFTGQWRYNASDAYIYKERRTYTAADYVDDTHNSIDERIIKTLVWSVTTDSPSKLAHWDELQVYLDLSLVTIFSAWTTPGEFGAMFTADLNSSSATRSCGPTAASRISTCEIPTAQRRSSRMTVTLTHTTKSEYFGIEGMALIYLPGESYHVVRT